MAVYLFSDVHLGLADHATERAKEDRLLAFLRSALPTAEQLYILGDLFDFWFEYRTVIPKGYHRTLTALQEYTDRGIPVHYLAGNHDFWMGDYFSREIGVTLHSDPFQATIQGKRVLLHHGDGLAARDLGYRMIKPVLRNRVNIALYRLLHPDFGVRLARGSSRTSRAYTSAKHYGEESAMLEYAAGQIRQGLDIVVMGHRHKPQREEIDGGVYVNLGDWISYNSYARMADGAITLERWTG